MDRKFWIDNPEAPFATLLGVIEAHCHPDADEDAYAALTRLGQRTDRPKMVRFKAELHEALNDPARVPPGALGAAADYDETSDEAFLWRLWRDLYGDEPV